MARGVRGRVYMRLELEEYETGEGAGVATKRLPHDLEYEWKFGPGTTDGTQMDRVYSASSSIASGTPVDLDLVGTTLLSVLDGTNYAAMTEPCVMVVLNDAAAGAGDAQLGAGTNPFTGMLAAGDVASVKPGGLLLWVAPNGATAAAGASDILRLASSTGTIATRVLVAGRSL